jgi:hypothetical protein
MKIAIIILSIVPYLAFCVFTSAGHLVLCLRFWQRPVLGFYRDLWFLYGRFIREFDLK